MEETAVNNATPQGELKYQIQLNELEAALLDQKVKVDELQKENGQLKRENNQLKRMPLFVAVVVDILENGEIYLRQQGNNQEYLTNAPEELRPLLKPGSKVAVNNALSIVKVIGNIYDSRVRVMELEISPEISYAQIGGLSDQIKEVREAVEYPLTRPEIFRRIGVEPPKGILLYGAPGTGQDPDRKGGCARSKGHVHPDVGQRTCPQVHWGRCRPCARALPAGTGTGTGDRLHR